MPGFDPALMAWRAEYDGDGRNFLPLKMTICSINKIRKFLLIFIKDLYQICMDLCNNFCTAKYAAQS